jgi:histidinol-phosphate phosphatase family protein
MMLQKKYPDLSVVILAGGKGKRLQDRTNGIPKPMVQFGNKTIIDHQLDMCASFELNDINILGGHKAEILEKHIKKWQRPLQTVRFFNESQPLGTGGALFSCLDNLLDDILVLYGDTFTTVDLNDFVKKYYEDKFLKNFLGQTLIHSNSHPHDSDILVVNQDGWVEKILPYPHLPGKMERNIVNAALYILKKSSLQSLRKLADQSEPIDIARDVFSCALENNFKIKACQNTKFIKDLGTPERIDKVEAALKSGALTNVSFGERSSSIFLDRDGCIVEEVGHLKDIGQLKLIPNAAKAIQLFNERALPVFCVTNQPVIARGEVTFEALDEIHAALDSILGEEGAYINKLVYCPHHPDAGYVDEIQSLKKVCNCRKPKIGLIHQVTSEYTVDLASSWMIGDTTTDIKTAFNSGMKSVLVRTGYGGQDEKEIISPDFEFKDVFEAANFILEDYPRIRDYIISQLNLILEHKIIFIGGLSGTGKTTFASVLKHVLNQLQIRSQVVTADTWIRPAIDRHEVTNVNKCYDMSEFNKLINQIIDKKFPIFFQNVYRNTISGKPIRYPTVLHQNTITIIEGCSINLLTQNIRKYGLFVWIDEFEVIRLERLADKCRSKGLAENSAKILHSKRLHNEDLIFNQQRETADLIWNMSV